MAIILQHEFWDLAVAPDAFEVSLNFSRKPERLTIPFDSITGFSDPSVPFGFKLEPRVSGEGKGAPASPGLAAPKPAIETAPARTPRAAPATPVKSAPSPAEPRAVETPKSSSKADKAGDVAAAKVVSIDAFRKK
jgi:hypothetical protein